MNHERLADTNYCLAVVYHRVARGEAVSEAVCGGLDRIDVLLVISAE
jgi:hypothetical protein